MEKYYLIPESALINIANAIREKTKRTTLITPERMPSEIMRIDRGDITGRSSVDITQPTDMDSKMILRAISRAVHPSGVQYYYNHEYLPEIPTEVVQKYPYLLIMRNLTTTRLVASTEKAYYGTGDDGSYRIIVPATEEVYRMDIEFDITWSPVGSTTSTYFTMGDASGWVAWWSNYNIIDQTTDTQEIYFPASVPTSEQPMEATHFYYNGVILPALPFESLEEYPYVFIYKGATRYDLVFANEKYWYSVSDNTMKSNSIAVKNYWLTFEDMEAGLTWSYRDSARYSFDSFKNNKFWSNYDIPQNSATATTIYSYGTLAVPV